MTDTWDAVMADATALAAEHGLEFHVLRNAWGEAVIREDADFYKDQGVTSSDMNHMLYGGMLARRDEVAYVAKCLGAAQKVVEQIANASGQHPTLVRQQLAELFAPVENDPVAADPEQYLIDNADAVVELLS